MTFNSIKSLIFLRGFKQFFISYLKPLPKGSASDLVKSAMVKIEKTIDKKFRTKSGKSFSPAKLVLQMHDEVIYEVQEKYLNEVHAIVKSCMENVMDLPVKMKTKIKTGKTWGTLTTVTIL